MHDYTNESFDNSNNGGAASPRAVLRKRGGESHSRRPLSEAMQTASGGAKFLALTWGIDSLYLSYRGEMLEDVRGELARLKEYAQDKEQEHLAQAISSEHVFIVSDKGRNRYKYLLIDGCFEIQLTDVFNPSIPVALVKVRSRTLTELSPLEVKQHLEKVLARFCKITSDETISRADLFLDFCCNDNHIRNWDNVKFLTRSSVMRQYYTDALLNAWDVGFKGDLSARIYNKTLEILQSNKGYLKPLWADHGWDGKQTIWRVEFQLRRPVLADMGIDTVSELVRRYKEVWTYLTQEWLRVVVPNKGDTTRSRWKTDALWEWISDACGQLEHSIKRGKVSTHQLPDMNMVWHRLCGPLSTIMAQSNIAPAPHGFKQLGYMLEQHLRDHCTGKMIPLNQHLQSEIKRKVRLFNLGRNDNDLFGGNA